MGCTIMGIVWTLTVRWMLPVCGVFVMADYVQTLHLCFIVLGVFVCDFLFQCICRDL
jgi:hypothetical protein